MPPGSAQLDQAPSMAQCCREFTLNMMSEWFLESANHTCGPFDRGVDEMKLAHLTPIPSVKVGHHAHQSLAAHLLASAPVPSMRAGEATAHTGVGSAL